MKRRRPLLCAEVDLPAPLATLVDDVVRRTRLWRGEKADVTAELVSHFREGLDDGRDAGALAEAFGDTEQAARLIRRARKRQRPRLWRIARRGVQVFAVVIGLYLLAVLYFLSGSPEPKVDYLALANAKATALPEVDRAWPQYREVLLRLGPPLMHDDPRPGDAGWDAVAAHLDKHAATIDDLPRAAAARPGLGFVVSQEFDPADLALWPEQQGPASVTGAMERSLYAVLMPYLADLRRLTRLLRLDAMRAAAVNDGATVVADVEAMIGVAAHAREIPFLINGLVGGAIVAAATGTTGEILATHPETLDDDALRHLAHRLGATDALLGVRFDGERYGWRDLVQRIYTDDGAGDGRITPTGLSAFQYMVTFPDNDLPPRSAGVASVAGPLLLATMMSRREALETHERILVQIESDAARPMWEWTGDFDGERQLEQWKASMLDTVRYYPIVMLMPALGKAARAGVYTSLRRDAVLVALALELDRRRRGDWAPDLAALVPDLLPEVPRDGFDGEPLRYAIVDGRPILYSVGNDRDDDGGRPPPDASGAWSNRASRWTPSADAPGNVDADWILWPPAPRKPRATGNAR